MVVKVRNKKSGKLMYLHTERHMMWFSPKSSGRTLASDMPEGYSIVYNEVTGQPFMRRG